MKPTVILTGPTASGKSSIAMDMAAQNPKIEIINADSVQVYRRFDIGSAKPTIEEQTLVRHHLLDCIEPDLRFTAGDFVRRVHEAIADIQGRGQIPLIVGGTGFYLKALLYGMWEAPPAQPEIRARLEKIPLPELHARLIREDPAAAQKIMMSDRYRLIRALEIIESTGKKPSELESKTSNEPNGLFDLFIIDRTPHELAERIQRRTELMLKQGFVEEVQKILSQHPQAHALDAVGYRQVVHYLQRKKPSGRKIPDGIEGLREEIILATRQLVKRQRTWFRGQTPGQWFMLGQDQPKLLEQLRNRLKP